MDTEKSQTPPRGGLSVFALASWVLGLVVFVQLLIAGLALSVRFKESRVVKTVIKEVPKLVVIRQPASIQEPDRANSSVVSRPPAPLPAASLPLPAPTPLTPPTVADPKAERLLKEARKARVSGDMMRAILKLQESLTHAPDDPSVQYELGLVHEQMGIFDTAATHYQKVFQMGVSGAGALYTLAAGKLRDGFEQPDAMIGKLSLGHIHTFNDAQNPKGQTVTLSIPIQKNPGEAVDASKVSVEVLFFNRSDKGEIKQLEQKSWATEHWTSSPIDWADDEETLRMVYLLPPQDLQTDHLFGQFKYYGQVITLRYEDEVLDVQAWPRHLAARITAPASSSEFSNSLLPEFDPNAQLLPPMPVQ
jgi:hypothetical protein